MIGRYVALPRRAAWESFLFLVLACSISLPVFSHGNAESEEPAAISLLAPGYGKLEFGAPTPGTYILPSLGEADDGSVLHESGKRTRLHEIFRDNITVLSFVYTRCDDVNGCPLATFVMQKLKSRLARQDQTVERVRLVSMSFDPQHDTPEVMTEFAKPFAQGLPQWNFLTTASEQELAPILAAYDQGRVSEWNEKGEETGKFSHIMRVFLIDQKNRIRNIYTPGFLHDDLLFNDIQTLLMEDS